MIRASRFSPPVLLVLGVVMGIPQLLVVLHYFGDFAKWGKLVWTIGYSELGFTLLYFVPAGLATAICAVRVVMFPGRLHRWPRTDFCLETVSITSPQVGLLGTAAALSTAISMLADESPTAFLNHIGPAFSTTVAGLVLSIVAYLLKRIGELRRSGKALNPNVPRHLSPPQRSTPAP